MSRTNHDSYQDLLVVVTRCSTGEEHGVEFQLSNYLSGPPSSYLNYTNYYVPDSPYY